MLTIHESYQVNLSRQLEGVIRNVVSSSREWVVLVIIINQLAIIIPI